MSVVPRSLEALEAVLKEMGYTVVRADRRVAGTLEALPLPPEAPVDALKTEFADYELEDDQREAVLLYERETGFDLVMPEPVVDHATFHQCLRHNMRWLRDWADETCRRVEATVLVREEDE